MPQGQVIGRISVRVLPDTDRFRSTLEKQLDRIEKSVKPVAVQARLDMTGFQRQMIQQIREINRVNRTNDARKIRFRSMLSTDGMNQEVKRALRALQARADAGDRVQFKAELTAGDLKLKISDQSLRDMTDQLKDWRDDNSPLKIVIEPDLSAAGSALTSRRLAILTRPRTVSIIPQLNNAAVARVAASLAALSGIRVLNKLFTRFSNILKNLDRNVPIIGSIATAIAGISAWGITATSNLFALSASLAQIGAVALTLPGILGGFAVGLGVTIAAFKDFNTVLPQVKQRLAEMQNQISSDFWAQAKAPIAELADVLLPRFAQGFRETAAASGEFFGSFASQLTAALNPEIVDTMFGYLNASIAQATAGTGVFASIIAQLGEVGTSYLPNLAGWFVAISAQFDEWLKKKGQLGLQQEIDAGITSLKDLGGVLYETGGILAGLSRAATEAGGSTLGMLRDTLASIHQTVDSPGFQAGMVDVFEAAHLAMTNLSAQAGPAVKNLFIELGQLLTTILPQAGTIIGTVMGAIADALSQPAVTEGVKAVFTGLLQAVQTLAPAMAPLGLALGALMQVIAAMLPAFAALITAAIIPLASAFAALAPKVIPIVELLAGELTHAFMQLAPVIQALVPVVGQMLGAAFSFLGAILPTIAQIFMQILAAVMPLAQVLLSALAPILPVLAAALGTILTALQPIVAVALQIITAVITPLLPMLSEIIQAVLPPLAEAIGRLLEALQPVFDALLGLVNFLMPILVPVIQFIVELLAGSLVAAVEGVALVFEGLVEIVTGVWDIIVGVLKIAWGLIKGIFTGNFGTLKEGWSQFWDGIQSLVKGVWDAILGALKTFLNVGILGAFGKMFTALKAAWQAGWTAVKTFGSSTWSSIKGLWSSFGSSLSSLGSSMMSGVKSLMSSGWSAVKGVFTSAWAGLKSAVSTGVSATVTVVKGLPGKIKSALGSLGSLLISAGKAVIKGFISGIKSMFGAVKGALGSLTDKLTSWKGPESLDRVILTDAGRLVIDGFINGLESRYDAVRKSLRGLTEDVAATEFDAISVGQVGVSHGVTSAINAAMASSAGGGSTKVLNYYAAPGSSLSSEEDLFAAANRARFGW
ncbi:phage tail protein [Streptomyces niveus]|uniref:phage tail protein n=1 Tax=Streptomyces niveus TaxID=193462 RepID=UPI0035E2291A